MKKQGDAIRADRTRQSIQQRCMVRLSAWNANLTRRYQAFLSRRPHRSFKQTYRRDYVRSLQLPGYVAFTIYVWRTLISHKKTFLLLVLLYAVVMVLVGAIASQDTYTQINGLLKQSSGDLFGSGMGKLGEAGLLALSTFALDPGSLSIDQQIYMGFSLLFAWLTTVWLLREFLLKRSPRLRDGLYNSGAPILSTTIVVLVMCVQLLPLGIMALAYSGLVSVGVIDEGFGSMLFWVLAAIVLTLVLYWTTSTIIALVVVSLPGMYPFRALRASSDLVIGRRLRIVYRWLWGGMVTLLAWIVVMLPVILLDTWIKTVWPNVQNVPFVPYIGAVMSAATTVWLAAYVYLLYRGIVDDDAKPA